MTSQVTVRSLFLILGFAGLATAQEPPPLEPPDLEPPRTSAPQPQPASPPKPTNPKPATPPTARPAATNPKPVLSPPQGPERAAATVRPESGPMLAIPGITAPTARPQPLTRLPAAAPPPVGISPFSSLLDEPLGFPGTPTGPPARSAGIPPLEALPGPSSRDPIPMTIEPLLDDPSTVGTPLKPPAQRPLPRVTPGTATPGSRDDDDLKRPAPKPAPRRMPGVLGRLFAPPTPEPSRNVSRANPRPEIESETSSELVAKRRIEREIRDTLGDRVRYVDVRITGRNAVVTAQPSRFWLRRSVRHSLETLSSLEGYRARIEIKD